MIGTILVYIHKMTTKYFVVVVVVVAKLSSHLRLQIKSVLLEPPVHKLLNLVNFQFKITIHWNET